MMWLMRRGGNQLLLQRRFVSRAGRSLASFGQMSSLCTSSVKRRNERAAAVEEYACKSINPVTLQQMLLLQNANQRLHLAPHLRNELLVRLARRYEDMLELPRPLSEQESVKGVVKLYFSFFGKLLELDVPDTREKEEIFTQALLDFYKADSKTLPAIATGMRNTQGRFTSKEEAMLNARLDDLFTARLSIRMLIGQHCERVSGKIKIRRGLCVATTARKAADTAREMCVARFGACPEIHIEGHLGFKFTYVESHLHHMLFELLKNSVRAVFEQHHGEIGEMRRKRLKLSSEGHLGADGMPPVIVAISGGKEDVVIKVSDEGGGIPRSEINKIWSYMYTTAERTEDETYDPAGASFITNFYGFGYGLPISRVFARYFGGDLRVISTEGWGTDAFIFLTKLESVACETLPE